MCRTHEQRQAKTISQFVVVGIGAIPHLLPSSHTEQRNTVRETREVAIVTVEHIWVGGGDIKLMYCNSDVRKYSCSIMSKYSRSVLRFVR